MPNFSFTFIFGIQILVDGIIIEKFLGDKQSVVLHPLPLGMKND